MAVFLVDEDINALIRKANVWSKVIRPICASIYPINGFILLERLDDLHRAYTKLSPTNFIKDNVIVPLQETIPLNDKWFEKFYKEPTVLYHNDKPYYLICNANYKSPNIGEFINKYANNTYDEILIDYCSGIPSKYVYTPHHLEYNVVFTPVQLERIERCNYWDCTFDSVITQIMDKCIYTLDKNKDMIENAFELSGSFDKNKNLLESIKNFSKARVFYPELPEDQLSNYWFVIRKASPAILAKNIITIPSKYVVTKHIDEVWEIISNESNIIISDDIVMRNLQAIDTIERPDLIGYDYKKHLFVPDTTKYLSIRRTLGKEENPYSAEYGTHIGLLVAVASYTSGCMVEFGCGQYSTPVLHGISVATKRKLFSFESERDWFGRYLDMENDNHIFHLINGRYLNETKNEIYYGECWNIVTPVYLEVDHIGMAFIDHGPCYRRPLDILRLKDYVDIFVVHDTEEGGCYGGFKDVIAQFKYSYTDKRYRIWTTALSDKPLDFLNQ